jgi:hypothetical protein
MVFWPNVVLSSACSKLIFTSRQGFGDADAIFQEKKMHFLQMNFRLSLVAVLTLVALVASGCGTMERMGMGGQKEVTAELTGAQEVPPSSTNASGKSTIVVADDKTVSGTVTVTGMTSTAAHIHQGAAGTNGPVIIPLTKTSPNVFNVPLGTKMTDEQYAAYKNGNLYINVHSAAYPGGEIRVQMQPS